MVFEIIIILSAIFGLIAAIFNFDMPLVRDIIAGAYVLYGLFHFPYQKEDRYARPGLGTGCIIIFLSGLLSYYFYSWWFLPGALLGMIIPGIINLRYDR